MPYVSRDPSARLAPFVSALWYSEGHDFDHEREKVLPHLGMQLLVNLDADVLRWWVGDDFGVERRARGALVSGIYERPFAIETAGQRRIAGVVFRSGGAPAVLGVPADRLANAHVELDALWGRGPAADLREAMLEAASADAALAALDGTLTRRLSGGIDPIISCAAAMLERGVRVAEVAEATRSSSKVLRRTFSATVGVTPKSYARIARFQRALALASSHGAVAWADAALELGYCDQAHLINEFRAFSEVSPSRYRPRTVDDRNHVVLAG